jgi:hypothetical protein
MCWLQRQLQSGAPSASFPRTAITHTLQSCLNCCWLDTLPCPFTHRLHLFLGFSSCLSLCLCQGQCRRFCLPRSCQLCSTAASRHQRHVFVRQPPVSATSNETLSIAALHQIGCHVCLDCRCATQSVMCKKGESKTSGENQFEPDPTTHSCVVLQQGRMQQGGGPGMGLQVQGSTKRGVTCSCLGST